MARHMLSRSAKGTVQMHALEWAVSGIQKGIAYMFRLVYSRVLAKYVSDFCTKAGAHTLLGMMHACMLLTSTGAACLSTRSCCIQARGISLGLQGCFPVKTWQACMGCQRLGCAYDTPVQ